VDCPLEDENRLHLMSVDCWCNPVWEPGVFFRHNTVNGRPVRFEPPIIPGNSVDADGYTNEDHR
jgi:hypothetical protein